ncbi:MAG: YncE family protein [Candidatus Babeliaceae bacterium]
MFKKFLYAYFLLSSIPLSASQPIIATISVGISPAGIAITPDSHFAYVANNNNDEIPGADTVSVLDLRTNTLIQTISDPSFNEPYTVTINGAGSKAYITNSNSTTITIIDIPSNTVAGTIDGFDGPSGMAIDPNTNLAYVNNYGGPEGVGSGNGTTVNVVDLSMNMIVGLPIIVGLAPASLAITSDGTFVYVINYVDGNPGTGTISIIRTGDNTVIGTIPGFSGPFSIAIGPGDNYAYITNFGSNNFSPVGTTMSVVDLETNMMSGIVRLGTQPSGLAITPNGRLAYVSNYNTLYLGPNFTDLTPGRGTVNIINIENNAILPQVLVVGASPANIAISPDGRRACVTNYIANTVSVINIFDKMWL